MWFSLWNKKKTENLLEQLDMQRLPRHIAIIMDGNGRWAQKRGLPRTMGHRAGVEALREVVKGCSKLGVEVLTVYAFSTENWKRPKEEVRILMSLLSEYLKKELNELHENRVKIQTLGDVQKLPLEAQQELRLAVERTKHNNGLVLNLALNYGGRAEIVEAVRKLCQEVSCGRLQLSQIDEEIVGKAMFTAGLPDPDLLIRTSGEMRLSNFLLWQLAYTEIVVTEQLWPDFNQKSLLEAIIIYQNRERRFGGLK